MLKLGEKAGAVLGFYLGPDFQKKSELQSSPKRL